MDGEERFCGSGSEGNGDRETVGSGETVRPPQ